MTFVQIAFLSQLIPPSYVSRHKRVALFPIVRSSLHFTSFLLGQKSCFQSSSATFSHVRSYGAAPPAACSTRLLNPKLSVRSSEGNVVYFTSDPLYAWSTSPVFKRALSISDKYFFCSFFMLTVTWVAEMCSSKKQKRFKPFLFRWPRWACPKWKRTCNRRASTSASPSPTTSELFFFIKSLLVIFFHFLLSLPLDTLFTILVASKLVAHARNPQSSWSPSKSSLWKCFLFPNKSPKTITSKGWTNIFIIFH